MPEDPQRYYQLVFIRVNDGAKFGRYLELMRPIVLRYGGTLERMLAPDAGDTGSMAKPDIVNVVHYDSQDAFRSFHEDPAFRAIEHLRSESIDMSVVNGLSRVGEVTQSELSRRRYVVEVARYRAGIDGYWQYEREAATVTNRCGYRVERVLEPDRAVGFPFEPNLVRIAYFDTADGWRRMQRDPERARLDELYSAAVSSSVWLIARVHPSTLSGAAAVAR